MKKQLSVPLLSLAALLMTQQAFAVQTCAQKEAALNEQLGYAQQHNNSHQVAGLKKALAEVKENCTASSVRQDAEQDVEKLQRKLKEKQQDLQESQQDLQKATAKNNAEKMAKYRGKIAEKQADIEKITTELHQKQQGLRALN
ncbi:DUF1090 domain-containing protein [Rosenbergiella epipactidis]|uniref:DUF1090 domain-containing protein n=1 Tax=Rosenbergiella epipactidis TaxID=1544694 RepID=UPI001BDB3332|nr:DUF1090 domain-containing protein [Rosenbergiella epipactidis]MBT0717489.1 DUF1090 domain-containing protein [Rosenbergiella epipactidis]